jgi:hypothetical protein
MPAARRSQPRAPPRHFRRADRTRMVPKKLAPAKAGVADFSDKIMHQIKEASRRPAVAIGTAFAEGRRVTCNPTPRRRAAALYRAATLDRAVPTSLFPSGRRVQRGHQKNRRISGR